MTLTWTPSLAGGKLLIAHGAADALVSTRATEDYYERLVDRYGKGAKGVRRRCSILRSAWIRTRGRVLRPGWDSLKALEDWVEGGALLAADRSRWTPMPQPWQGGPLCGVCPAQWPRYDGHGVRFGTGQSFRCLKAPGFQGYDGLNRIQSVDEAAPVAFVVGDP